MSYVFYALTYARTGQTVLYPVYMAPVVVYLILAGAAFAASRLQNGGFKLFFGKFSICLVPFAALFLTPVVLKLNLPDPHNFLQRKLELMLGASYALFVAGLAAMFIRNVLRTTVMSEGGGNGVHAPLLVFLTFFASYFSISLWLNYANMPTGDEPYYLLASHSMVHDRDIDLKNNYAQRDYGRFYPGRELGTQALDVERDGRLYGFHPVLVSVFIAPFYAAAGRLGATMLMNAFCAAMVMLVYMLCVRSFADAATALRASVVTGFSLPLLMFSNQIVTESASGAVIAAVWLLARREKTGILPAAILLSLLPWLHPRNVPVYVSLFAILALYRRRDAAGLAVLSLVQAVSLGLFAWFNYAHFGSVIPDYGEAGSSIASRLSGNNLNALAGLMFDQEFGMFFYAPVFCLVFAGIYLLFRKDRKTFWETCAIMIPYLALITSWFEWRGGGGASPRFFVPVIAVFAVWLAAVIDAVSGKRAATAFNVLAAAGWTVSLIIMMVPWFRWNKGFGENWILKMAGETVHIKLSGLFPSIWSPGDHTTAALVLWIAVVAAANAAAVLAARGAGSNASADRQP